MQPPAAPRAPRLDDLRAGAPDLTRKSGDFRPSRKERMDDARHLIVLLSYAGCVAVALGVAWRMSERPSGEQWTYLLLALALGWAGTMLALQARQRRTRARRR